jgi:hypothetical protein
LPSPGDGLYVGGSQAAGGLRSGSVLTTCIGDHVLTYDTKSQVCKAWSKNMTRSPSVAGECRVDATPPSFVYRQPQAGGDAVRLNFVGDGLLSPALAGSAAESRPTFDAAIQRANALYTP